MSLLTSKPLHCNEGSMSAWLEERIQLKQWLTRPAIPRGWSGWRYFPGVFAIVLILWQIWTGICIAPYTFEKYFESGDSQTIYNSQFLQSGHRWGAYLLLISVLLHFLCNFYQGTYRKLGELPWISGLILALILLAFFWTGAVLPYYERGETGSSLAAMGSWFFQILCPHPAPKFFFYCGYVLHIAFLPLALLLMLTLHLWLTSQSKSDGQ